MKGRLTAALAAVALLGAGIAVAVGSLGGDAMISKSYYENTWLPALGEDLRQRAETGLASAYDEAADKLSELAGGHEKAARELEMEQDGYQSAELVAGDSLELTQGSGALLLSGSCRLKSGALADVTAGTSVAPGQDLAAAHRYIVTAEAGAVLEQTSAGGLRYQGAGTLQKGKAGETALPFTDVEKDQWYYEAVAFVYGKGYFAGTGENVFSPNAPMDRAMVATVLHRVSGSEAVDQSAGFLDVPAGQWYSAAIDWASAKGVVNGMGDGLYAPTVSVTREQLVTMLYRYQKDYRKAAMPAGGDLSGFPDGDQISSWAREAMSWAVGAKLMQGRNTGALDPTGTATRAEVAAILQRFFSSQAEN